MKCFIEEVKLSWTLKKYLYEFGWFFVNYSFSGLLGKCQLSVISVFEGIHVILNLFVHARYF